MMIFFQAGPMASDSGRDPHDRAGRDADALAARGCARAAHARARAAHQARLPPHDSNATCATRPTSLMVISK